MACARCDFYLPKGSAALALGVLGERLSVAAYIGIVLAPIGIALISPGPDQDGGRPGWFWLALLSLALQGIGAFIAKLVVTPSGPSSLLLLSAGVQVVVGLFLAPPSTWSRSDLRGRTAAFTIVAYVVAGIATIGYLLALASGPAALVVPLVATSPAVAGLLGILVLNEKTSSLQLAGIGLALAGAVLLSSQGRRP